MMVISHTPTSHVLSNHDNTPMVCATDQIGCQRIRARMPRVATGISSNSFVSLSACSVEMEVVL